MVVCDLGELADADLETVDALARLQLVLVRHGCRLQLVHAPGALRELIALAGLAEVLELRLELALQAVGQAEQGEQASGVQKEGDAADPIA